jgi:hypothetical protein
MHTDMPGAAVSVIKNPTKAVVPPVTLSEAAQWEVCHSRCWESKVITQVYWVHSHQVSKTPPTGLFIPTGSFMIYGKRNFITPTKMDLGFTLMFALDNSSLANHAGERKVKLDEEEMEQQTQLMRQEIEKEELASQASESMSEQPMSKAERIAKIMEGEEVAPQDQYSLVNLAQGAKKQKP